MNTSKPSHIQTFAFSRFSGKHDNNPKAAQLDAGALSQLFLRRSFRASKDGALISGATYPATVWRKEDKPVGLTNADGRPFRWNDSDNPTPEDWRAPIRANEFVESVSLAIFDFDNGTPLEKIEAGVASLNNGAGAAASLFSTFSHTPDKPKFRLVLPLSAPVIASDWPLMWAQLAQHFDGAPDVSAKDAARMHFLPSCPKSREADAIYRELDGTPLDVATLPQLIEPAPESQPPAPVAPDLRQPRDDNARRWALGALRGEVSKMQAVGDGQRHNQRQRSAHALGGLVPHGLLSQDEIFDALCVNFGADVKGAKQTIRDGIKTGIAAPRDLPDFSKRTETHQNAPISRDYSPSNGSAPETAPSGGDVPAPSMRNERGALEYEPGQLVELLRPGWTCAALSTHTAHAARILEHIGGDLRFSPQLGWLTFSGRQWQRDDRHATQTADRAKILSQTVREEAATLYGLAGELARTGRGGDAEAMSKAAAQHTKHAKQVEAKNFVEGALHFAAGNSQVRVSPDAFDQRPWLLGFQNGVWDAGDWREHRRDDLLLNLCPVELDFGADRREWQRVLEAITGGDTDFARTLQDVAGYILSGASHLRFLPWLYGPKGTGKSTFAELLQTVLGRMAATIDPKKLKDDGARERLGADLWNRRLAVCGEAGNQKLEAELLKTLSGADTLTVRFLYQEAFDATPRHVLLMVSNDAPKLDAYDDALKDRVVALPFVHRLDAGGPLELSDGARVEAVRKDPNSALVRGFAAWALDGLAKVHQSQSIFRAPILEAATAKFWADTDPLTPFWESVDADDLRIGIGKSELRDLYEKWCASEGLRPKTRNEWSRACRSKGLENYSDGKKKSWRFTELTQLGLFSESPRETVKETHRVSENCISSVSSVSEISDPELARLVEMLDSGEEIE